MRNLSRVTDSGSMLNSISKRMTVVAGALALLVVRACSGPEESAQAPASPTSEPASTAASASSAQPSSENIAPVLESGSTAIVVQDGTTARYIVGERGTRLSILSEAIGETSNVTGTIIFNENGSVLSKASVLTVGVDGLTSDESREDGFLRRSSIQTSRFPDATFSINGTEGLDWPLPSEGSVSFTLLGNMTIRDVTKPVTLVVEAQFTGDSITATASTIITFDRFEMSKPSLAFILSVEGEIRLELDIQALVRKAS